MATKKAISKPIKTSNDEKKILGQEKKQEREKEQAHLAKRPSKSFDKLTQKEKDDLLDTLLQWWMER